METVTAQNAAQTLRIGYQTKNIELVKAAFTYYRDVEKMWNGNLDDAEFHLFRGAYSFLQMVDVEEFCKMFDE
jgi:hypothetical protein